MNDSSKSNLLKPGFCSLLVVQFLGAANDNVLKQILIFMILANGLWAFKLGAGGQGYIGLCLTLPFILFSGYAGQFSDRNSKRFVTILVKAAEIFIALAAGIGLWLGYFWVTLASFIALAVQSAFFGPAKFGMIPELVTNQELSRANGAINMLTNIAIILGTLIAGPVCQKFFPKALPGESVASGDVLAARVVWLPLAIMLGIACLGFVAAFFIPKLPAKNPELKYKINPFDTYYHAIIEMAKTPMLAIAIAWSYFYMVGMIALLIVPEYESLLNISYVKASALFAVLAVAIGFGCAVAGWISGKRIEPRFVPIGGIGITVFFFLLGIVTPAKYSVTTYYYLICTLLVGAGLFAGFYLIPLQALIQGLAPDKGRGRFLGTTNALSFVCSSLGAVIIWLVRGPIGIPANRVFLVCAGLMFLGVLIIYWKLKPLLKEAVVIVSLKSDSNEDVIMVD